MMNRHWRQLLTVVLSLTLVMAACGDGDDDDEAAVPDATTTTTEAVAEPGVLNLLISDTGLEGLPDEIPGGVVTVNLGVAPGAAVELEPGFELDFSLVEEGTTEEEFVEALPALFEGGPFPDFFQNNAGVGVGESAIELLPGPHIVWFEFPAPDEEEEGTTTTAAEGATTTTEAEDATTTTEAEDATTTTAAEEEEEPLDIRTATLTVTEPEDEGELPETDGIITATDYAFDVDVSAGNSFTFRNDSPEEFHHAILFNFGTIDPATVEENLIAFLETEGEGEPPPGLEDVDPDNLEAGGSAVFGPGLGGTATAALQEGNTYAAVCFIQDRAGGPPHVFAHDMYEVFQVD